MVEQTTLHNILTCVIAVIIFIFQSLNYIIAWIKQYVNHKEKSTTAETADTTISVAKPNDNNTPESFIAAQELIQRHFDIPLIVAEDDPKVNNLTENTEASDSNTAYKDEYDLFMDHLTDDSFVARGLGLITATLGREAEFYLYSKYDNDFEGIVIELRGRNGEIGKITITSKNSVSPIESKPTPIEYIYDKDRIKVLYTLFTEGVHTLTLSRNNIPICRSPYYISVEKSPANSRSRIRLGTRKCRVVTKFGKGKHTPVETKDNSIPVAEPSKSTVKSHALPMAEETPIRTDVMSIITQFESKNKGAKIKVQKRLTSITEKSLENDSIRGTLTSTDKQPNIETSPKKLNTYDNVLNICKINSRLKITNTKCSNSIDINHENNKQVDTKNTIDINSEEKNKVTAKLDENVEIANDILQEENVLPSLQKDIDSVDVLDDKTDNSESSGVEKHNEDSSANELLEKRDSGTVSANLVEIQSKVKSTSDEENIKNDVLHSDCDSEKPIVLIENTNELESNPNDKTIQQTTDPTQYNINTLSASTIKKITNSLCEKCSKQVIGILSELPRDINIKYNENPNEKHSNFETLLAQPIRININIDNVLKNAINTNTNESSPHSQTNSGKNIEPLDTNYSDVKCLSPSEKESLENDLKKLDVNNMQNAELVTEQNLLNDDLNKTFEEIIPDKVTIPLTEHNIEIHQKNKLSENETILPICSENEDQESINSNIIDTYTIHKQEIEVELQIQDKLKSIEQTLDAIKSNDCDTSENLNHREKCGVTLETNDLLIIDDNKNKNKTLSGDESELIIEQEVCPEENSNFQSKTINDTVLTPINVVSTNEECTDLEHKQQKSSICEINDKNIETFTTQVEDFKLMIEKCFEPVLNSFKNDIIEKMLQLCLNKDFSNENHTKIIEKTTNDSNEIKYTHNTKDMELNIENEELTKNDHDIQIIQNTNKKEVSGKKISEEKTDDNIFFKQIEKIVKKNVTPINSATSAETKLQQIVNAAMHNPNDPQKNTIDDDTISEKTTGTPLTSLETSKPEEISEKLLSEKKTCGHQFLKQIENIIKKNLTSINTATSAETKLQEIVNAAMHNPNDPQKNTFDDGTISEEIVGTLLTSPKISMPNVIITDIEVDLKHAKLKENNDNRVGDDTEDLSNEKPDILLVDNESKSYIADTAKTLNTTIIENIENKHEIPPTSIEIVPEENTITVIESETTSIPQVLNKSDIITVEKCNTVKVESDVQISESIENLTELTPLSKSSMSNDSEEKTLSPEKVNDTVENLVSNNIETLIENLDKSDESITYVAQSSENAKNIINSDSNTLQIETLNETVGDTNDLGSVNIINDTTSIEILNTGEDDNIDETKQLHVDVALKTTDSSVEEISSPAELKPTIISNITTSVDQKSNGTENKAQSDQSKPCDEEKITENISDISENTRELDTKSQIQKLSDTKTISENDIYITKVEKISIKKTKENNYIEDVHNKIDGVNIRYDPISNGITTSVHPEPNVEQSKSTKEEPELNYINITVIAKSRTINIQITMNPEISNKNNSEIVKSEEHNNINVEAKSEVSTMFTTEDELNEKRNSLKMNSHSETFLKQPNITIVESKLETPEIESIQAILPDKILQNETKNLLKNEALNLNNDLINDVENVNTEIVTDISISKDDQSVTTIESQEMKSVTVSEILNSEELKPVSIENKTMVKEETPLIVFIQSKNELVSPIEQLIQIQTENKLEISQDNHDTVTIGTSQNTDTDIVTSIPASKIDETLPTEETMILAKTLVQDIGQNEIVNETNIEILDQKTVTINTSKQIDTETVVDNQELQVEQNVYSQEILKPEKRISKSFSDSSESELLSVDQSLKTETEFLSIDLNSKKLSALSGDAIKKEGENISLNQTIVDIEGISIQETVKNKTESPTKNELTESKTVLIDNLKIIDMELKANIQDVKTLTEDKVEPESLASQIPSDTTSTENTECSLVEETIHNDLEIDKRKTDDENKTIIEDSIQPIRVTDNISIASAIDRNVLEEPMITKTEPLSLIPDETEQKSYVVEEKMSVVPETSKEVQPISIEEKTQNEIHSETSKEDSSKAVDTETSINITEAQTYEMTITEKSVEPTVALVKEITQNLSKKHLEIKLVDLETIVIEISEQIDEQTVTESQASQCEQTMLLKESIEPASGTLFNSSESEIIPKEKSLSIENDITSVTLNSIESSAISIEEKTEIEVNIPSGCIITSDKQIVSVEEPIQNEIIQNSKNEEIDHGTLVEDLLENDVKPVDLIITESQDGSIEDKTEINVENLTDILLTETKQSLKVDESLIIDIEANYSESEDDKMLSKDFIQAVKLITNIIPISPTTNTTPEEIQPKINTDLTPSPVSLDKSTVSEDIAKEEEAIIESKLTEKTLNEEIVADSSKSEDDKTLSKDFIQAVKLITNIIPISSTTNTTPVEIQPKINTNLTPSPVSLDKSTVSEETTKEEEAIIESILTEKTQSLEVEKTLNEEIVADNSKSEVEKTLNEEIVADNSKSEGDKTLSKDFIQAVKLITNIIPISTTTNTTPEEIIPKINTDHILLSVCLDKSTVSEEIAKEEKANILLTPKISEDTLDILTEETTQHKTKKFKVNELIVSESVELNTPVNTNADISETYAQKLIEKEIISTEETPKSDNSALDLITNSNSSEKIVSVKKHTEKKIELILTTSNSKYSPTKSVKVTKQEDIKIQITPTVSDDVKYVPTEEKMKIKNEVPIEKEVDSKKTNEKSITEDIDIEKERNLQKLQQDKTISTEETTEFKNPTSDLITICDSDIPLVDENSKEEMELESVTSNPKESITLYSDSTVTDHVPTFSVETEIQNANINPSERTRTDPVPLIEDAPKTKIEPTSTILNSTELPVIEIIVKKEIVGEIVPDMILNKITQTILVKETILTENIEINNSKSEDENKATIEDSIQPAIQLSDVIPVSISIDNTILEEPTITETEPLSLILDETGKKSDEVEEKNSVGPITSKDVQPISIKENNQNEIHSENISLSTETSKEYSSETIDTETSINITETQAEEIATMEKSVELTTVLVEEINQNETKINSENKMLDSESAVIKTEKQIDKQIAIEDPVSQNEQTLEIEELVKPATDIFIYSNDPAITPEQELSIKEKDTISMDLDSIESLDNPIESEIKKEVDIPSTCIKTNDEKNVSIEKTLQNSIASKTKNDKPVLKSLVKKPLKMVSEPESLKLTESPDVPVGDELEIEVDVSSSLIINDNVQLLSIKDTIQSKTETQPKNETVDSDSIIINNSVIIQAKITDIPESEDILNLPTEECIKQKKKVTYINPILSDPVIDLEEVSLKTTTDTKSPIKSNESSILLEVKTKEEEEHTSLTNTTYEDTQNNSLTEETIPKETDCHTKNELFETKSTMKDDPKKIDKEIETSIQKSKHEESLTLENEIVITEEVVEPDIQVSDTISNLDSLDKAPVKDILKAETEEALPLYSEEMSSVSTINTEKKEIEIPCTSIVNEGERKLSVNKIIQNEKEPKSEYEMLDLVANVIDTLTNIITEITANNSKTEDDIRETTTDNPDSNYEQIFTTKESQETQNLSTQPISISSTSNIFQDNKILKIHSETMTSKSKEFQAVSIINTNEEKVMTEVSTLISENVHTSSTVETIENKTEEKSKIEQDDKSTLSMKQSVESSKEINQHKIQNESNIKLHDPEATIKATSTQEDAEIITNVQKSPNKQQTLLTQETFSSDKENSESFPVSEELIKKEEEVISLSHTIPYIKNVSREEIIKNETDNLSENDQCESKTVEENTPKNIDAELKIDSRNEETLESEKIVSETIINSNESKIIPEESLKIENDTISMNSNSKESPVLLAESIKNEDKMISLSHTTPDISGEGTTKKVTDIPSENELIESKTILISNTKIIDTEFKESIQNEKTVTKDTVEPENPAPKVDVSVASNTSLTENTKSSLVAETMHNDTVIDTFVAENENKATTEGSIQPAIQVILVPISIDNTALEEPTITETEPLSLILDETGKKSDEVEEKNSVGSIASKDVQPISIEEKNQNEIHTENTSLNTETCKEDNSKAADTKTSINIIEIQADEITTTEKYTEPTTALVEKKILNESKGHSEVQLVDPATIVIETIKKNDKQSVTESMKPVSEIFINSSEYKIISEECLKIENNTVSTNLNAVEPSDICIKSKIEEEINISSTSNNEQTVYVKKSENEKITSETLIEGPFKSDSEPVSLNITESQDILIEDKAEIDEGNPTDTLLTKTSRPLEIEEPLNIEIEANNSKSEYNITLSKDFIQAVKLITNIIPISPTTNTTPIEIPPKINTDPTTSPVSLDKSTVSEEIAKEEEAIIKSILTEKTQSLEAEKTLNEEIVADNSKSADDKTLSKDFIQAVKLVTNIIPISTTTNTTPVEIQPKINTDLTPSPVSLDKPTVSEDISKKEEAIIESKLTEKTLNEEIVADNSKSEDDKTLSKDFIQAVKLITNVIPISTTTNTTPEEVSLKISSDLTSSPVSLDKTTVSEEISKEEEAIIEPILTEKTPSLKVKKTLNEEIVTNNSKSEDEKTLNLSESQDESVEDKLEVHIKAESSSLKSDDAQLLSLEDKSQYENNTLTENKVGDSETTLINTSTNIHAKVAIDLPNSEYLENENESSKECIRLEKQDTDVDSIPQISSRTPIETLIEPVLAPLNDDTLSTSPEEITKKAAKQISLETNVSEELQDISIEEIIEKDTKPKVNERDESGNIFKQTTNQTSSDITINNQVLQNEQNILTEETVKLEEPVNNVQFPSISDTILNEESIHTETELSSSSIHHEKSPDVQNFKEVTMISEDVQSTLTEKSNQNKPEIQPENEEVDFITFLKIPSININLDLITDNLSLEYRKTIIEDSVQPTTQVKDTVPTSVVSNETLIEMSLITEIEPVSVIFNTKESSNKPVRTNEETPMISNVSEMKIQSNQTTDQNEIHPENKHVKVETLEVDGSKTINIEISKNNLTPQENITTSTKKSVETPKTLDEKINSNEEDSHLKIKLLDSELIVSNTLKQADEEIITHNQVSQFEPTESMKKIVESENKLSDSSPISSEFDITSVQKTFETENEPLSSIINSEKTPLTDKIKPDVKEEISSTNIALDDVQIPFAQEIIQIATIPQSENEPVIDPETMIVHTTTNIQTEIKTDTSNSNYHKTLSTEEPRQPEKLVTDTIIISNDLVSIEAPLKIETESTSMAFISTEFPSESLENTGKNEEKVIQNESINSKNESVFPKKRILYTSISNDTDTENDAHESEDEQTVVMKETINSEKQMPNTNSIFDACGEPLLGESLITEKKPLSKFENILVTQIKEENNKETQALSSAQIIKSSDNLIKNLVHKETENQFVTSILNDNTNAVSANDAKSIDQEVASAIPQNYTKSIVAHGSTNVETEIVTDIPSIHVDETSIKVQELDNIKVQSSTISALQDNSHVTLSGEPLEDIKITSPETPISSSTDVTEKKQNESDKKTESNSIIPSIISSISGDNECNTEVDTSSETEISDDVLFNAQESTDTSILPIIKLNKIKIETMTPTLKKISSGIEKPMDVESIDSQKSSCSEKSETAESNSSSFPEYGESSKKCLSNIENKSQQKSYGIQKLEMSVQRMKTSDDDYFEKTVVQLEQTEKISIGKNATEDENNTAIDDKLYAVNESDLNAIVCASSLQEALTLLDTKIKFKFKHNNRKPSSKGNSAIHKPSVLTPTSSGSNKNANFTEARKFFKEMEKKSKK